MSRIVNSTMPKRIATFGMICATMLAVSACQTLGGTAANTATKLDASASRPAADLVFNATAQDQELNALGRAVYEGLFSYSGTLDGNAVSGYAWGEIQGRPPAGHPTPPNC